MTTEVNEGAVRRSAWCRNSKPALAEPTLTDRFVTMIERFVAQPTPAIRIPPAPPAWTLGPMAGSA